HAALAHYDGPPTDDLQDALLVLAAGERPRVVLDLSRVDQCDSSALNLMVQTHRAAAGRGGWLRLVAPVAQVRRTLEITNLTRLLGVYATVADATGQGRVLASNAGGSERMRGRR